MYSSSHVYIDKTGTWKTHSVDCVLAKAIWWSVRVFENALKVCGEGVDRLRGTRKTEVLPAREQIDSCALSQCMY
jgi:hypothetical protein